MIFFFFYGNSNMYCIANKNRLDEPNAIISIGHGHFIDHIRCKPDGDGKNKRTMRYPFFEWLRFAPFFIHVMGKEIS